MSEAAKRILWLVLGAGASVVAQMVWASSMAIGWARPCFPLLLVTQGALFCNANGGAALGFWAGLLYAAVAAPPRAGFGSMVASSILMGFLVGWLEEQVFRDSIPLAMAIAAGGTALAQSLFFLMAPQPYPLHWALGLLGSTLYNTLLAFPLYLLLRRLIRGPRKHEFA